MRTSLGVPPESIVKALSRPKGKNFAKATGQLLSWAESETDQALMQRSLHLMRRAILVVKEALPNTDPELIGGFFANLLDLWETGQKLDKELHNLTKLRFPRDRARLRAALIWVSAIQIDMASFWVSEVKQDLPRLLTALDKLERKPRSGRQKRKLANARSPGKRRVSQRATASPNSAA